MTLDIIKFFLRMSLKLLYRLVELLLNKGCTVIGNNQRYQDGYFWVWDDYMWLTSTVGQLSRKAPLCWKQTNKNHSCLIDLPLQNTCDKHPRARYIHQNLQVKGWFTPQMGTPNGTRCSCGTNLWPWWSSGWIGRSALRFARLKDKSVKTCQSISSKTVMV